MLSDIADTLRHVQRKERPKKLELRVDCLDGFAAAFEAEHGPLGTDEKGAAPALVGIPIVEDPLVAPGMAVVLQDGFVVDIIRYAPKEPTP